MRQHPWRSSATALTVPFERLAKQASRNRRSKVGFTTVRSLFGALGRRLPFVSTNVRGDEKAQVVKSSLIGSRAHRTPVPAPIPAFQVIHVAS